MLYDTRSAGPRLQAASYFSLKSSAARGKDQRESGTKGRLVQCERAGCDPINCDLFPRTQQPLLSLFCSSSPVCVCLHTRANPSISVYRRSHVALISAITETSRFSRAEMCSGIASTYDGGNKIMLHRLSLRVVRMMGSFSPRDMLLRS